MNAGFIYTWEYIITGGTYVPTACDNTKQLLSYSVTGAVTSKYELRNFRSHCCPSHQFPVKQWRWMHDHQRLSSIIFTTVSAKSGNKTSRRGNWMWTNNQHSIHYLYNIWQFTIHTAQGTLPTVSEARIYLVSVGSWKQESRNEHNGTLCVSSLVHRNYAVLRWVLPWCCSIKPIHKISPQP